MTIWGGQRRLAAALFAGTAMTSFAVPAYAQDTSDPATSTEPTTQSEAAAPAEQAADVDTGAIVVTARRRNEALQDTPVAVSAVNAAMLEDKASVNIGDLVGAVPNLLITNQNSGAAAANLSIRGLTFADIEKSFDPTVAVNVDGVFIGTSTGQFFDMFDIDQIEVLRGPQGTLFGRNTIGGVINIRRSRPKHDFTGKMELSYGKYDTLIGRAVVNVPLGDTLAMKAFYFHNESEGFYRHAIENRRAGGSNNENFGASFLWEPTDNFDALLTLEKQVQEFEPVISNLTRTGEVFCALIPANQCNRNNTDDLYTVFNQDVLGKRTYSNYEAPAATLEMNANLGSVKLTSVTGYRKSNEDQTQDFDGSSSDLYHVRRQQKFRQWSQELRAAGKFSDNFDYVVGGYYYNGKYTLRQNTRFFGAWLGGAPTAANAQIVSGTAKSFAVFGDFNLQFGKFRVNPGARWTRDKKSIDNFFFVPLGQASKSFSKFTPKVSVDFRPNDDHMVYASWSRGYRSGGFSNRAQTALSTVTPFGPETVDSYEVGYKGSFLDNKLEVNLAAFMAKYKDLQQNTTIPGGPTGNETIVFNVGSAKIKGLEGEINFRPMKGLRFSGTFGYLTNKFKDFITTAPNPLLAPLLDTYNYSSVDMIYAPKFNGSVSMDYSRPTSFGQIAANVGYRYVGRYDQQISLGNVTVISTNPDGTVNYRVGSNDPRVRTDHQNLLDASLKFEFSRDNGQEAWLTFWGRNLLDDRGPTHGFTVAGLWSFGTAREPRTYGITAGFKF